MPISQATILAIYGDLCDLVEKIDTAHTQATEPDLFMSLEGRASAVFIGLEQLKAAAHDAQRQAIAHIISDDPRLEVNPITGRLDE